MKATSTAIARTPATPATASVPSRVDRTFLMVCMTSSSSRHERDAASERAEVARRTAAARAHVPDVLDEVADDVARVVARNRVVALALARVREPAARRGPACDVELGEGGDRNGRAAVAAEGP